MGRIWSDAQRVEQGFASTNIGYTHIKQRRLERPVVVSAGGVLGEYVPFNFCNRSVMLYTISRGNVASVPGGQTMIAHLVSSVDAVAASSCLFAFTDRHADLSYARYSDRLADLPLLVDQNVMGLQQWADVKEIRQAEFLVHDYFPWELVEEVCVHNKVAQGLAITAISGLAHQPPVVVRRSWYY